MTTTTSTRRADDPGLVIDITTDFAASPERVFHRWTDADALARWFAPPGYAALRSESDPRPGGSWRLDFRSDSGEHSYSEQGAFTVIEPHRSVAFTLTQVDGGHTNPETLVTVELEDIGTPQVRRTRMHFTQSGYHSPSLRNANEQGWRGCFEALATDLDTSDDEAPRSAENELRELFQTWFEAAAHKDLDAQMASIAGDVVSYEHDAPQEYRGVDAVREVCAAGLEYQDGEFRWDIPDLQIRIAGDIAVTWGLNRMRNTTADGALREDWSRGTRIFERRDNRWQLIHQHVSFPIGPDGRAFTQR